MSARYRTALLFGKYRHDADGQPIAVGMSAAVKATPDRCKPSINASRMGLSSPGLSRGCRQNRRGKADLLLRAYLAPVADLGAPNLDRPDASLDRAMRPMAVTHHAVATVR